ncbi:MAG TPA: HEAT repeat domain-containing protein [Methylomirabilota bacterium]
MACLAEALALALALAPAGPAWWPLALAAHAGAAWLAGRGLGDGRPDARFLAAALVLALPGIGLVGLGAIRLWRKRAVPVGIYAGAHAEMAGLPGPAQTPEPVDRVFDWLQAQVSVQPVADLMRAADPRTQRWGVGLLAKRGDGAAVELLREALRADDRDTQIAASGALQRVEERLMARLAQAQEQLRLDPESPERLVAVGDACVAYHESGLLDPAMGRHWLGEAEAAFRAARAHRPRWPVPARALARVRLAQGQVAEAETLAAEARAAAPSTETDLLLSEILFVQGRWSDLRALSQEAVAAGRADDTLRWWAGEPPA